MKPARNLKTSWQIPANELDVVRQDFDTSLPK
jgi:hypothetical protein